MSNPKRAGPLGNEESRTSSPQNIISHTPGKAPLLFRGRRIYPILEKEEVEASAGRSIGEDEKMPKRKPGRFSVTKAVKANARERVGQPKPAKVVDDAPRTGRKAKHKPKLEQVIEQAE